MKKEFYRHILPHFQKPGQAYFVTWSLKDAVPKKALVRYSQQLESLKSQIELFKQQNSGKSVVDELIQEYYAARRKYIKAYDDLLDAVKNPAINLSKSENTKILMESIKFWEGKLLKNFAYAIMPNHVHWVLELLENDESGNPVYLQDILQSVKRHSANRINKAENRQGNLWQKENFDTTIRDERHLYYAIEYTLNNPVAAGLVKNREDWPGSGCGDFQSPL